MSNTRINEDDINDYLPILVSSLHHVCGPGSSVGIATGYGLNDPGIKSRWGRNFPHLFRPALEPTSLQYNGYRGLPGGKERPGCDADHSPPSSSVVKKE